jgi:protein-tyrosine phosphatase
MAGVSFDRQAVMFSACFNFRELGGYPTAGGPAVRKGQLYRSDSLHRLSGADLDRLAALGIRTVLDLRTDREVTADGGCPAGVDVLRFPLDDALGGVDQPLALGYVATVEAQCDVVASAVVVLADPSARPAVFHCTSGRDRTGILAALVLDLLGVPDDVIAADYVLSVDSRRARDAYLREHEPERAAFFASLPASVLAIDASTMELFLRELRARHGSVRALLEAGGAPAAALDRLVDDLVDRAME